MPILQRELLIETLGAGGDGIARTADGPVYVPYTLPGERVLVELGSARGGGRAGRAVEILEPSPERIEPACRHFGACGGCAVQHLAGTAYLAWKRRLVADALARRGLADVEVRDCIATPPASRRRVRLRADRRSGALRLGLNRRRGREVVALEVCPVLRPSLVALLDPLRAFLPPLLPGRVQVDVQLTETEGGVDLWVASAAPLSLAGRQAVAEFAGRHDLARISWGPQEPETVVRRRPAAHRFGPALVEPPAAAFLQASAQAEAAIVDHVGRAVRAAGRIVDLFSGAGALSLPLAPDAAVTAIDADAGALDALAAAVRHGAGLKPLEVRRRDLFRRPLTPAEFAGFDAVVLDPPRAGARAQAEMLAGSTIATIAAVSCHPASFARDARILVDGGYRLEAVTPIDQFLWSPEVELVGCFRRQARRG